MFMVALSLSLSLFFGKEGVGLGIYVENHNNEANLC